MATVQRATLFNPTTNKRVAVDVGSQQSRDLFGQGYKLETNVTNTPAPTATDVHSFTAPGVTPQQGAYIPPTGQRDLGMTGTDQPVQPPQQNTSDPYMEFNNALSALMKGSQGGTTNDLEAQRNALINARFNTQQATPEDAMKRLSPAQQDAIRSGQVEGLNTQLAGVKTAISGRQEEQKNAMSMIDIARNLAKDAYTMDKGVDSAGAKLGEFIFQNVSNFDSLTPADQQTVANNLGISLESLQKLGASAKNQLAQDAAKDKSANTAFDQSYKEALLALKTPQGSSVTVLNNTIEGLKPLKTATGGTTSYKVSQDFQTDIAAANAALRSGQDWGSVWNGLHATYPQYSTAVIDAGLDQRFREQGAYQSFIGGKSESQSAGTAAGKGAGFTPLK